MKSLKQKRGLPWLAGILILGLGMYGGQAMADIAGSAHDFSDGVGFDTDTWNTSGEICVVCHTPHEGDLTIADAPLWNHEMTAVTTYIPYTNPSTLDATTSTSLSGLSKLCLSCHDGTVALDSYGGATGGTFIPAALDKAEGAGNNDLSNDHPIAIAFTDALATTDGSLNAPSTTNVTVDGGDTGTITTEMLFGADQIECATCHDVHNKGGFTRLLRIDNAGSALCLTCHAK